MTRIQHRPIRPIPALLLAAALLSSAAMPALAASQASRPETTAPTTPVTPRPPLRSRAELDAWLKANAGRPTPLDAMTAGGRQRFLDSLTFGEGGVGSLSPEDLLWDLDNAQARAVLALFDQAALADVLKNHQTASPWRGNARTPSSMDDRYTRFARATDAFARMDYPAQSKATSKAYRDHFPRALTDKASTLSDADLLLLARAAAQVAPYTGGPEETRDLFSTLPLLEKRGLDIAPLARGAQRALLGAGKLDEARAFAAQHPSLDLEPLPTVAVAPADLPDGPRWWRLSADGTSMRAESADLSEIQLIVLAGCHFSAEVAEDVEKDSELKPVFARHSHWLALPLGSEDVASWKEWNSKFPDSPMQLITRRSDWPMFPEWRMPTYAIVRNGTVIDKTIGSWRNMPENRTALIDMLRRHGLMAPQAP